MIKLSSLQSSRDRTAEPIAMGDDVPSLLLESKQQVVLAAPVSITLLLNKSVNIVSVLVVAHLGPAELAAASLAHSLANVLGNSMISGLASGLSTLCGQVGCLL